MPKVQLVNSLQIWEFFYHLPFLDPQLSLVSDPPQPAACLDSCLSLTHICQPLTSPFVLNKVLHIDPPDSGSLLHKTLLNMDPAVEVDRPSNLAGFEHGRQLQQLTTSTDAIWTNFQASQAASAAPPEQVPSAVAQTYPARVASPVSTLAPQSLLVSRCSLCNARCHSCAHSSPARH